MSTVQTLYCLLYKHYIVHCTNTLLSTVQTVIEYFIVMKMLLKQTIVILLNFAIIKTTHSTDVLENINDNLITNVPGIYKIHYNI